MTFPPTWDCARMPSESIRWRKDEGTHDKLERSLERGTECMTDVVRVLEHVAQPPEKRLDRRLRFDEVDEDVAGFGKEDVVQVTDD